MTDWTTEIEKFVCEIRRRNRREVVAALLLLPVFGLYAMNSPPGSLAFWGHVLIALGIFFVLGMMSLVASLKSELTQHPASDLAFWRDEMLRQARLLRLVPLWYIAPILPGLTFVLWPTVLHVWKQTNPIDNAIEAAALLIIVTILGAVWWLNSRASDQLKRKADQIREWEADMQVQPTS